MSHFGYLTCFGHEKKVNGLKNNPYCASLVSRLSSLQCGVCVPGFLCVFQSS